MKRPRTPGAGIARARDSLGSENSVFLVTATGFHFNRRDASAMDRVADLHLAAGRTALAERLAFRAADMREASR